MSLEDALEAVRAADAAGQLSYQEIAKKYGVERSTLSRRHRGVTRTVQHKYEDQQQLTHNEELELVSYIDSLCRDYLPPTRDMIRNFASTIAKTEVSETWVTRFLHRHHDALTPQWTSAMATERHAADSYEKYSKYFDMLELKITEKDIQPEQTYNMDEKGFMIRHIGRQKRVFSKTAWSKKQFRQALMDGNREWITLIACVGASGVALPPALIFAAESNNVQDAWVRDIKQTEHRVFVTVTPSGWSNDDAGLGWLQQVFDVETAASARRRWRLLIIDGHGSHVSRSFLTYCHLHKILVAVFPPHSTHTLQPADVVLFKPLSTAYSNELTKRTARSRGLLPVKKGSFFSLFWPAWVHSFTRDNISKAFEATGIHPLNRDRILNRFAPKPAEDTTTASTPLQHPPGTDSRTILRQFDRVVGDKQSAEVRALRHVIHHLAIDNELLRDENKGLIESLSIKKRQDKKSKALDLVKPTLDDWGGARWYSPRSFAEARHRERILQDTQHQEKLEKARIKELKKANKLYNNKIAEQKRVAAAQAKEVRDRERAEERAAINARKEQRRKDKEARNAQNTIQLPNKGKRKASTAPAAETIKKRRVVGARSRAVVASPAPPTRTHTTRSGRIATQKY
jgi:transcriptional regulator with XRE-family HTH domain